MTEEANPYQTPTDATETLRTSRFPRVLVVIIALVLLARGLMMAFAYASRGLPMDSFMTGLYLKDAIYGVSALLGACLLIYRSRVTWTAAIFHWAWYVAYEHAVVLCAVYFGWIYPFAPGQRQFVVTLLIGLAFLAALIWRPTTKLCGIDERPWRSVVIVATSALVTALLVNGLALSKWW